MVQVIESSCGNTTYLAGDEIPNEFYVSDEAKKKIDEHCADKSELFLRIMIMGGGCAGFQYMFGYDTQIAEDDIVHDWGSGKVVVDRISIDFMKGSTIEYVNDFEGEHFVVRNPHAKSECGCGSSFSY